MSNGNGGYGEYDAGAGEESWTSDPVGRMVGEKYRIVGRIGGGGVADVFEAVHVEIGQRVAIKVLKREYARLDEVSGRFLTEARAAGTIGHPGIVRIHDIGSFESGRPYLVMERLVGPTLADVLDERGRLPREEAVGICVQLLDALEAAHRAGVIHRDLKPENVVLVEGPGGDRWAKIIDFGIARLTREGAAAKRLTMQGSVVGTPYYLSPEQARGSPNLDGRVDVYAAGVMLHEMLTGTLPFEGASVEEILTRVLSAPFPDPRALLPDLPEGLEAAIRRATARRRDDRFASARAFAEALRPFRAETVSVRILAPEEEAELLASLPPRPPRMRSLTPPPCARPASDPPQGPPGRGRFRSPVPTATPMPAQVVPRRTLVWTGVGAGVAAALGAVLIVLWLGVSPRTTPDDGDAGRTHLGDVAGTASATPATSLPPTSTPEAAAPAVGDPNDELAPAVAPAPRVARASEPATIPATATITVVGFPDGAALTLDGAPTGPVFELEVSDATHTLEAAVPGHRPYVHVFRADRDATIEVSLEREPSARPAASPRRPRDPDPERPSADPAPAGGFLANPFGAP